MGAYLCIASNDVPPSVSKRILLTIQFPPSVVVANQLLGVSSRSSVVLECFVEAFPHTHNYWMKNHGESIVAGPNYEVSERKISPYQFRMKLKITDLTGFETGSYTCVATNQLGKADGTIRIYEIATTTTSTTTTTTTTEAPPTVQFTSTTEQQPFYHAIPLPPAEQKFLTDDTTTHSSENEIFEQSVLDSTWPTTKTHYSLSNTESLKPYCTVIVFIFTCLMS